MRVSISFRNPSPAPLRSPLDEPLEIVLSEAPDRIRVCSTLRDDEGLLWIYRGSVDADDLRECRLCDAPAPWAPEPGAHSNWECFWRLTTGDGSAATDPTPGEPLEPTLAALGASHYSILLEAEEGTSCRIEIQRDRLPQGVDVQTALPDPLRGQLFIPPSSDVRGAVLVLGGSEGGIPADRAAALAGRGYATLALGYFAYSDRPAAAEMLPLEYFAAGLRYLRKHWPTAPLTVWGGSRGSEAAMLCAITYQSLVDGVIAWVPSPVVNPGFDMAGNEDFTRSRRAMWSLHNQPLPDCGNRAPDAATLKRRRKLQERPPGYRYRDEFLAIWQDLANDAPSHIPIEQSSARVLIVSAEDDGLWPSSWGGSQLERRLAAAKRPGVRHLVLPACGHAIGMPHAPRPYSHVGFWPKAYAGTDGAYIGQGGDPHNNARGAVGGWLGVLEFLGELEKRTA